MALVDIITLIEREAAEKASSLLDSAKTEASLCIEAAKVKAKKEVASLEKDGIVARETLEKRKNSEFTRNERVAISIAKQELVDSVFTSVKQNLQNLSGDDLSALFVSLLKKIPAEKGEILVCGGKKSEMDVAVKIVKKDFTVSECTDHSCEGGFIYKGDGFEMDFSFSNLVEKELRPLQEGEIFKALF